MRWLVVALSLLPFVSPGRALAVHTLGLEIHASNSTAPTLTKTIGLPWVRVDLDWDLAQPANTTPDFTAVDAVITAANTAGLKVLLVLQNTPVWASSGNLDPSTHRNDVPTAGSFAAFAGAAAMHFHSSVNAYELWSDPNLTSSFEGTSQQYLDLVLRPGADAVHTACPSCRVVSGGLSTLSGTAYDVWADAILSQASDQIDVFAGHIYAGFPEDDPAIGTTSDSFLQKLESHRAGSPNAFKEIMDGHGFAKPFWLTATGYEATLGTTSATDAQTSYYRHVLEKASTRAWWQSTFFYEALDSSTTTFGVAVTSGGSYTKKPVFDFLKVAVAGEAFGGVNGECSDGLDNDGDGLVDFPADFDCLGPTGLTEGNPIMIDGGVTSDGGVSGGGGGHLDGGMMGGVVSPGGDVLPARKSGCAYGGAAGEMPVIFFVIACCAFLLARRRA